MQGNDRVNVEICDEGHEWEQWKRAQYDILPSSGSLLTRSSHLDLCDLQIIPLTPNERQIECLCHSTDVIL